MKRLFKKFFNFRPIRLISSFFIIAGCSCSLWFAKIFHKLLIYPEWNWRKNPQNFNHYIDLFQWLSNRDFAFAERGVMGAIQIQKGNEVLELACGDGFNAKYFFSTKAKRVVACDYDTNILAKARKKNAAKNVFYVQADITKNLPDGKFDNIICDATLNFFEVETTVQLIKRVKQSLKKGGVFSGSVMPKIYDPETLKKLLEQDFTNVTLFESEMPSRPNLYFWASVGD